MAPAGGQRAVHLIKLARTGVEAMTASVRDINYSHALSSHVTCESADRQAEEALHRNLRKAFGIAGRYRADQNPAPNGNPWRI